MIAYLESAIGIPQLFSRIREKEAQNWPVLRFLRVRRAGVPAIFVEMKARALLGSYPKGPFYRVLQPSKKMYDRQALPVYTK